MTEDLKKIESLIKAFQPIENICIKILKEFEPVIKVLMNILQHECFRCKDSDICEMQNSPLIEPIKNCKYFKEMTENKMLQLSCEGCRYVEHNTECDHDLGHACDSCVRSVNYWDRYFPEEVESK